MEAPSKKLEISTMTHEEEEEMHHDISKLRDPMQQISLSQKVIEDNMDDLNNGIEANINCMEANMDGIEA